MLKLTQSIRDRLQRRFNDWIRRRLPPVQSITLNQKRLFVFPSRQGLYFLLVLMLMLVAAINYQNNMSFAVTFLMVTVFVTAILHTFANCSGLTVKAIRGHAAFAGDDVRFDLQLSAKARDRFGIRLDWKSGDAQQISVFESTEHPVAMYLPTTQRGLFRPQRLLLESIYPLGLIRVWTWLHLDIYGVVYPKPYKYMELPLTVGEGQEGELLNIAGSDDFYGLDSYRPGDPLKHVFWKSYAKGQDLQLKKFSSSADHQNWLDWEAFSTLSVENRLSCMCYWALWFDQRGEEYGLRIPGVTLAPASGDRHKHKVLRALALYGEDLSPEQREAMLA